jgi:hypothetical protein
MEVTKTINKKNFIVSIHKIQYFPSSTISAHDMPQLVYLKLKFFEKATFEENSILYLVTSKLRWRFHQIVWPSQNILTLLPHF